MAHPDPVPMRDHWRRLGMALAGKWKTDYQPDRKSSHAGYWGEVGHALKNVPIEFFRKEHWWNRKGKTKVGVPYRWPED